MRHPWAKRQWTLQELAVADNPIIQCGRHRVSWGDFILCIPYLFQHKAEGVFEALAKKTGNQVIFEGWDELMKSRGLPANRTISDAEMATARAKFSEVLSQTNYLMYQKRDTFRSLYQEFVQDFLSGDQSRMGAVVWMATQLPVQLLLLSEGLDATDLRDKIYGINHLLGFLSPLPEVDYGIANTAERVYEQVTRHVVKETQKPHLVIFSATVKRRQGAKLPSWVPDWGACADEVPFRLPFEHPAGTNVTLQSSETVEQSQTGELAVDGQVLTTITRLACTWEDHRTVTGWDHICVDGPTVSHLIDWVGFVASGAPASSRRSAKESGIVVADMLKSQLRARDADGDWMGLLEWVYTKLEAGEVDDDTAPAKICSMWHPDHYSSMQGRALMGLADCVLFLGQDGRFGLCRQTTVSIGDVVVLLAGSSTPVLLHRSGNAYQFLGPAYIHGVAKGQDMWKTQADVKKLETFVLI
jgi:hypothetical protein